MRFISLRVPPLVDVAPGTGAPDDPLFLVSPPAPGAGPLFFPTSGMPPMGGGTGWGRLVGQPGMSWTTEEWTTGAKPVEVAKGMVVGM